MNYWFTSDPHYFHRNVIKYCKRPYTSQEEMHEALIANWNAVVAPEDYVYVLGDFAFCGVARMAEILKRLNGIKFLIPGNHDSTRARMEKAGFIVLSEVETLRFAGRNLTLCHYPYAPTKWESFQHRLKNFWKFWRRTKYTELRYLERRPPNNGRWLLHGHVHRAWKQKGRQINVGVDVNDYRPVNIRDIIDIINQSEGR